jgi:RNA polymerase sigma factor (sigma-70 family)
MTNTTTNTTKTNTTNTTTSHEPITLENVQSVAAKAAYHTLKLLEAKSASDTIRELLNGFTHLDTETVGTNDLIQTAIVSLLENMDNENAFKLACRSVRQYIYAQSNNRGQYKHMYIADYNNLDEDGNPDIEDVNNGISALLKRLDNTSVISTIVAQLSPTQRKVLHYISLGYTNITISKRLGISDKTVSVHVARIRAKARELYPDFTI